MFQNVRDDLASRLSLMLKGKLRLRNINQRLVVCNKYNIGLYRT